MYSVEIYVPQKAEEWGYECRMDALSSVTLFICHTHVPSGFFLSMSCGGGACVCECVWVSMRSVHFPAFPDHKSLDWTVEHCENCAVTQSSGHIYCMSTNYTTNCKDTSSLKLLFSVKVRMVSTIPWHALGNYVSWHIKFHSHLTSLCVSSGLQIMEQESSKQQERGTTRRQQVVWASKCLHFGEDLSPTEGGFFRGHTQDSQPQSKSHISVSSICHA